MSSPIISADKKFPLVPFYEGRSLRNQDLHFSFRPDVLNILAPIPKKPTFLAPYLFVASFILYLPAVFVYFLPKQEIKDEPINHHAEVALAVSLLCLVSGIFNFKNKSMADSATDKIVKQRRNFLNNIVQHPNEEVSAKSVGAVLYLAAENPNLVACGPMFRHALQDLSCPQIQSALPYAVELINRNTASYMIMTQDFLLRYLMNRFNPHVTGVLTEAISFSEVFGRFRPFIVDVTLLDSAPTRKRFIRTAGLFDACMTQVAGKLFTPEDALDALRQYGKSLTEPMEAFQKSQLAEITFANGQTLNVSREFLKKHSVQFKEQLASPKNRTLDLQDEEMRDFINLLYVCENGTDGLSLFGFATVAIMAKKFKFDGVTDLCLEKFLNHLVRNKYVLCSLDSLGESVFSGTQMSPDAIAEKLKTYATCTVDNPAKDRFEVAFSLAKQLGITGVEEALLGKVAAYSGEKTENPDALRVGFCALALEGKKKEATQASIAYYRSLQSTPGYNVWHSWKIGGVPAWERDYYNDYYKSPEGIEALSIQTFGLMPDMG